MLLNKTNHPVVVWTLFVRITHWFVALCVLVNFFNATGFWHRFIGYVCLGLVLMRVAYGLWVSRSPSSRFYLPTFASIRLHLTEIKTQHFTPHDGHNPLGQLAVYLMWLIIILLALTGWVSRTDAFWGEDWPVDLHAMLSSLLQTLVLIHVCAVAVMSKLQKKNLVKQIITGQSAQDDGSSKQ